jgi:hypothetical protein
MAGSLLRLNSSGSRGRHPQPRRKSVSYFTRSPEAARRNGFFVWSNRYLSQLGSWNSYTNLTGAEQIPERVAQITAAYLGLKGLLQGQPRLTGTLGALIGVHALEYFSAGAITTWMRLYGGGRPLGTYRGITIRHSPATTFRLLNRLTGGRLFDAGGCYFFESGRTWGCRSWGARIGDQIKTLALTRSYSLPHREFWFDRPIVVPETYGQAPPAGQKVVMVQRVINMVLGEENPDTIPGFIGSVNELEDLSGVLGYLKRGLFLADWLLRDESERDGGQSAPDYEALAKGSALSGGSVYRSAWPQPPLRSAPPPGYPSFTPSGSSQAQPGAWPASVSTPPSPLLSEINLFAGLPPVPGSFPDQAEYARKVRNQYKDRLRLGDKEYPLVVKRVNS